MGYFVESNVIIEHESLILVKERWEILTLNFRNGISIKFAFCTHFSITGVLNESKTLKHNYHFFFLKLWLNIHQLDSNKQGVCDNDSNAEMLGDFNQAF